MKLKHDLKTNSYINRRNGKGIIVTSLRGWLQFPESVGPRVTIAAIFETGQRLGVTERKIVYVCIY